MFKQIQQLKQTGIFMKKSLLHLTGICLLTIVCWLPSVHAVDQASGNHINLLLLLGHTSRCGDGVIHVDEECDDGNLEKCDGCSDTCNVDLLFDNCTYDGALTSYRQGFIGGDDRWIVTHNPTCHDECYIWADIPIIIIHCDTVTTSESECVSQAEILYATIIETCDEACGYRYED